MTFSLKTLLFKSQCSVKHMALLLFSMSACVVVYIWIMYDVIHFLNNVTSILSIKRRSEDTGRYPVAIKYILSWHGSYYLNDTVTTSTICTATNCIFTRNRQLLDDPSRFDAILYHEQAFATAASNPNNRSSSQLYVFATLESAYNYPSCELRDDNFFNWTFTYRLDSDVVWSYFTVKNASDVSVAPSTEVAWEDSSSPIKPEIKNILLHKTMAAAWLVSHCGADSLRDDYITRLQEHLYHFSIEIDVYGGCSKAKCPYDDCEEMLKKDYFFYMAFENSISEDYVTEKVLHGYNNYAVPIVYGGANYSRFLPPGSYLNAREVHPYNLAYAVHQAIKSRTLYESYFKWTNLYTFNIMDSSKDGPFCRLCEALNSEKSRHAPAKKNFRIWWNGLNGMKWCLSQEYWNEKSKLNIEAHDVVHLY